ncbi:MAG: MerR family transcriptional regulator [Vicinamibacterales bacterium]
MTAAQATIPNRPVFRAQEVCDIAQVQAYVLRSWEAEFPDLGVAKSPNGQRVYRRADVERVLRLKHLLFTEGLTLAGARRRLVEEGAAPAAEEVSDEDVAALLDSELRDSLRDVRRGLHWVLGVLSGDGTRPEDFVLMADSRSSREGRAARGKAPAKKARAAKPSGARSAAGAARAKKGKKR